MIKKTVISFFLVVGFFAVMSVVFAKNKNSEHVEDKRQDVLSERNNDNKKRDVFGEEKTKDSIKKRLTTKKIDNQFMEKARLFEIRVNN